MKRLLVAALLAGGATAASAAPEYDHATHGGAPDKAVARDRMWQAALARAPLAATAAFDRQGRLWLARVENGRVLVGRSDDAGKSFSPPVAVNAEPERIAADGENRPKLAFGRNGEVYVSWTQSGDQPFSGHVRFARSLDGGRTFGAPLTVNDDRAPISHRFDALLVTADGRVHLLWLDKRESAAAQRRGEKYAGISLYYAVSTDRGASFAANRKLADHSCECCRIAVAPDVDGTPVALWRHVFGMNIRDHALLRIGVDTQPRRVTHEQWAVDACPHHGPALAIGTDGVYHLAWFSGAPEKPGLYYAHSVDGARTFSVPLAFGSNDAQAGHPALLARNRNLWLAWKEFDGRAFRLQVQHSGDRGQTWSVPQTLAATNGSADYPQLVTDGRAVYLAWSTANEGLRLIALDKP